MKLIIQLLIIFIYFSSNVFAEKIRVFSFTNEELDTLEVRKVRGADAKTEYLINSLLNLLFILPIFICEDTSF